MISEDILIKPKPVYDKSYSSFTHKGDHQTKVLLRWIVVISVKFPFVTTLSY